MINKKLAKCLKSNQLKDIASITSFDNTNLDTNEWIVQEFRHFFTFKRLNFHHMAPEMELTGIESHIPKQKRRKFLIWFSTDGIQKQYYKLLDYNSSSTFLLQNP